MQELEKWEDTGKWRKDQGLLSRSGRKRCPQSRDDGGVSWVFTCWVFVAACGLSLVAVHWLLIAEASLVARCRL